MTFLMTSSYFVTFSGILMKFKFEITDIITYDVISITRSSINLYIYYFIIKYKLFMKILQRDKNTKIMKFVQNYNMPIRYKLEVTKIQPTAVYTI